MLIQSIITPTPSCSTYNPIIVFESDRSAELGENVVSVVLGMSIKVNGIPIKVLDNPYSPQPREIKHRLQETEQNI